MKKQLNSILQKIPFVRPILDDQIIEVINGASVAMIMKLAGAGLAFCFNLLLARLLGADGAGIYFLALTVTTVATVFGRMGMDNALLRFTSVNASVSDWQSLKGLYTKGMTLAFVASFCTALLIFFLAPLLAIKIFNKPELSEPLRWMVFAIIPMSFVFLYSEMLKGIKRVRDSVLISGVGVPGISLICLYSLVKVSVVSGAAWAYVIGAILTASAGFVLWRRAAPQLNKITGRFDTQLLVRTSIPMLWVTLVCFTANWTIVIMLGIWCTNEDVGVFGVASRTAMLTSYILFAVNVVAAPKFAALYQQNDIAALAAIGRKTTKLMTLLASPLLLLFIVVPRHIMGIYGPQFVQYDNILVILALAQFINVGTGSVGNILMMSGNEKSMRNIVVFTTVLQISTGAVLIKQFGVLGAAIATIVGETVLNLISTWVVYKKFAIVILPIPWRGRLRED